MENIIKQFALACEEIPQEKAEKGTNQILENCLFNYRLLNTSASLNDTLPYLRIIERQNGLKLNRMSYFDKALYVLNKSINYN